MSLPTRKKTAAIEREGINFTRGVVEAQNSIFHEIHHENDYGNDAFIEFVDGEEVTGVCVAAQIKSGSSYCTPTTCRIPHTEKQANYWRRHSLSVLGIVYDPDEHVAYWIDLAAWCRHHPGAGTVVFLKNDVSRFDAQNFREIVAPRLIRKTPQLDFQRAKEFALSLEPEAHSLGLRVLLHKYHDTPETWEIFHQCLISRPMENLDRFIAYAHAHIPWHGDIAGPVVHEPLRSQVQSQMATWNRRELLPLLGLIDENGVERGTPGQSVYAIVDLSISQPEEKLRDIIFDSDVSAALRENAVFLFSLIARQKAVPVLQLALSDSRLAKVAGHMLSQLREAFLEAQEHS